MRCSVLRGYLHATLGKDGLGIGHEAGLNTFEFVSPGSDYRLAAISTVTVSSTAPTSLNCSDTGAPAKPTTEPVPRPIAMNIQRLEAT